MGNQTSDASRGVTKQCADVPIQPVAAGTATKTHVLIGPDDGAPNFALRRFVMGESGGMPRHTNAVEHEQFVLTGAARVTIGDAVHEVAAGTALYIPAEVPHRRRGPTKSPRRRSSFCASSPTARTASPWSRNDVPQARFGHRDGTAQHVAELPCLLNLLPLGLRAAASCATSRRWICVTATGAASCHRWS